MCRQEIQSRRHVRKDSACDDFINALNLRNIQKQRESVQSQSIKRFNPQPALAQAAKRRKITAVLQNFQNQQTSSVQKTPPVPPSSSIQPSSSMPSTSVPSSSVPSLIQNVVKESNEEVTITAVRKPQPVQQFLVRFEPFWPHSTVRIGSIPKEVNKNELIEFISSKFKVTVSSGTDLVVDSEQLRGSSTCITLRMGTKEDAASLVRVGNRKEVKMRVNGIMSGPFSVRCCPSFKIPYKWEFWFRATEGMDIIKKESVLEKLRKKTTVGAVKLYSDIGAEKELPNTGKLSEIIAAVFDKQKYALFVASQQSALATFHARYSSQGSVVSNGNTALLYHDNIPYSANSVAKPFVFYYRVVS